MKRILKLTVRDSKKFPTARDEERTHKNELEPLVHDPVSIYD